MNVRMVYHLSGMLSVVHHNVDAVGLHRFLQRMRDLAGGLGRRLPILGRDVENIARGFRLRNDECVAGADGVNVEERERFVVLVHFKRRQFAAHYLAENTIFHSSLLILLTQCSVQSILLPR